ncbi:hypothetical protein NT01EI_3696 [Edwardsiella ictaluri 93-146]|uniref:Uncharacterized protein n=1 Tax=Edwardsiella ictaluri (strain 93-146) TaxID=634503 RepID=C5B984_EDWI9|nr:hypothetical protein NT01EI_3696 [Edwardsiella ictaluri 93-146]
MMLASLAMPLTLSGPGWAVTELLFWHSMDAELGERGG